MSEETYPHDLTYFKEHDWVRVEGQEAVLGITWFAQDALGEVVYVELPAVGDRVTSGQPFGELESVKSVSSVYSPVTGQVRRHERVASRRTAAPQRGLLRRGLAHPRAHGRRRRDRRPDGRGRVSGLPRAGLSVHHQSPSRSARRRRGPDGPGRRPPADRRGGLRAALRLDAAGALPAASSSGWNSSRDSPSTWCGGPPAAAPSCTATTSSGRSPSSFRRRHSATTLVSPSTSPRPTASWPTPSP